VEKTFRGVNKGQKVDLNRHFNFENTGIPGEVFKTLERSEKKKSNWRLKKEPKKKERRSIEIDWNAGKGAHRQKGGGGGVYE